MLRRRRRLVLLFFSATVLTCGAAVAFMLLIDWWMERQMGRFIYTDPEAVPPQQVALVLGAGILGRNRLSAMLEDRVLTAIELYKSGRVKKLLMSGDNSAANYDEVSAMRRFALKQGVVSDDIVRDFAGFRTYDSIYRARDIWGQHALVIVTQEFHLPRAVYTARKLGIEACGLVADRRVYARSSRRRSRAREILARSSAWFECNILHPRPKFLGTTETLSGDSQFPRVPDEPGV